MPSCPIDYLTFQRERKSVERRFWAKVNKAGPVHALCGQCWIWTAYRNRAGYGQMGIRCRLALAHRISWMLHNGPIPEGQRVLHRCDNPGCINPEHLFLGSQADNVADMIVKQRDSHRSPQGEQNGFTKLTEEKVREIRRRFRRINHNNSNALELAREYGISRCQLLRIVNRQYWSHVD